MGNMGSTKSNGPMPIPASALVPHRLAALLLTWVWIPVAASAQPQSQPQPLVQPLPQSEQLYPASPATPAAASATPGSTSPGAGPLITVQSDLQQADNTTGVVTATGNVRVLYPEKKLVATARQAQYFTKEGRIVLIGDVDVVQEGGNRLKAQRVTYLVAADRLVADPAQGDQVKSWFRIKRQSAVVPAP